MDPVYSWDKRERLPLRARQAFEVQWLSWATKGVLAIADQGLFAGTNLLLNVCLARWLSPANYGVFALTYSAFILFSSLHSAMLVEPMLVFGPGKYRQKLDEYVAILVQGHFLVMLPLSLLTGAIALLIGHWSSSTIEHAFLTLACTTPFILLSWILRRAFYVELMPLWATFGGVLYLIVLLSILFLAHQMIHLSTDIAFGVMGFAAVIVSFFLLLRLRPCWRPRSRGIEVRDVAISHWCYGRWSLAAAAFGWVPANIYYVLLPAWFGLEESAALRALTNLINPVVHVLVALTPLLVPALVRNRQREGEDGMNRTMTISLLILLLGTTVFSVFVWFFRAQLFHVLYGGKYQQFNSIPLLLLLISLLAACFTCVLAAGQMALERPDRNFWSYIASSAVTIVIGLPLAAWRGVEGASEGLLLSTSVTAAFMYFLYRRARSHGSAAAVKTSELVLAEQRADRP